MKNLSEPALRRHYLTYSSIWQNGEYKGDGCTEAIGIKPLLQAVGATKGQTVSAGIEHSDEMRPPEPPFEIKENK